MKETIILSVGYGSATGYCPGQVIEACSASERIRYVVVKIAGDQLEIRRLTRWELIVYWFRAKWAGLYLWLLKKGLVRW